MDVASKSPLSAGSLRKKSKHLFFILCLSCASLLQLRAEEGEKVSMSIDLVAWGDDISGLSLGAKKSQNGTTALAFRYSDPVKYSGAAMMEVYQGASQNKQPAGPVSDIDKEHESQPLAPVKGALPDPATNALAKELAKRRMEKPGLVALVPLPTNSTRRVTVLLAPQNNGTFSGYVIDDDPSKLALGKIRIHNLSPHPIAFRSNNEKRHELKPGQNHTLSAPQQQLIYELAYQKGDKWTIQENNIIPVHKNEQTQMIILKSSNSFFLSSDGSSGGYLQCVLLRRVPTP